MSPLKRSPATILQLNIGLYCNQACSHCHVESSPKRTEMMSHRVAVRCIELLRRSDNIRTLDITGGAPELNSEFRYLVQAASQLGVEIIDRCNLTVLMEPGQEDLVAFLANHKVRRLQLLPAASSEVSLAARTAVHHLRKSARKAAPHAKGARGREAK